MYEYILVIMLYILKFIAANIGHNETNTNYCTSVIMMGWKPCLGSLAYEITIINVNTKPPKSTKQLSIKKNRGSMKKIVKPLPQYHLK